MALGGSSKRVAEHRQRHRHHRRPSATLLGILSALVSVDGRPLSDQPPGFLCPTFTADYAQFQEYSKRSVPSRVGARYVPEKYAKEPDGRWRRQNDYTLFGSKFCVDCSTALSDVDDAAETSNAASQPSTTTTAEPTMTPSTLPKGWGVPSSTRTSTRTTVIVSLTIGLSIVIIMLMVSCLFWRKSKRKKEDRDLERRARRRLRQGADDAQSIAEKEAKAHKKMWARATARWKANIRHTARQRRSRRAQRPTSSRSSSVDLNYDMHRSSAAADSIADSPGLAEPSAASPVPSPPAYNLQAAQSSQSIPGSSISRGNSPCSYPPGSHSWTASSNELPLSTSFHVATDEKSTLARMAELASSPPEQGTSQNQVSAPAWYDERFEDFPSEPPEQENALFPPPTSMVPEYSYSFDDDSLSFVDNEPSAPPFEAIPSAPIMDEDIDLVPSAPPEELQEEPIDVPDDQEEPHSRTFRPVSLNINIANGKHPLQLSRRSSTNT